MYKQKNAGCKIALPGAAAQARLRTRPAAASIPGPSIVLLVIAAEQLFQQLLRHFAPKARAAPRSQGQGSN